MKDWISLSVNNSSFKKTLLDWIISNYQIFTVTESWWFKQMMQAEEVTEQISDNDAIKIKIKNHIKDVKQKINKKLVTTASIVAVSFDEWNQLTLSCTLWKWCDWSELWSPQWSDWTEAAECPALQIKQNEE